MDLWYYGSHGEQSGPVPGDEIRAMIAAGSIGAGTLLWREGMEQWLPLGQVPEFAGIPGGVEAPAAGTIVPGGAPVPGAVYPPVSPTSGLAIASLVCGILGVVAMCAYVGGLFGLPAVICGHLALGRIRQSAFDPLPLQGRGMAIAGLITGYIAMALQVAAILFFGFFFVAAATSGGGGMP